MHELSSIVILILFIIAAFLLLAPLFMVPLSPPGIPLLLVFPVVLAAILTFLIVFSN
ncbi:uncharacterized protein LOC109788054 [Cajanus cajan]|uniref:uncharacterized protein LOC109788054 n=1 Tax=Cajanus cajan TaxID=3821 RepID=UPI00098DA8CC|nr:uncharacterized protein LOC109788054 [Cajanus cajan]